MVSIYRKNIAVCIILSVVTFGIYGIYWDYLLVKNVRAVKGDESRCLGEMLCLELIPFYPIYWWFTRGKFIRAAFTENGFPVKGHETAYLLLSIFGLEIVCRALMQNDFNALISAAESE